MNRRYCARTMGDPTAGVVASILDWQKGCENPTALAARMTEAHISGIVKGAALGLTAAAAVWIFLRLKGGAK